MSFTIENVCIKKLKWDFKQTLNQLIIQNTGILKTEIIIRKQLHVTKDLCLVSYCDQISNGLYLLKNLNNNKWLLLSLG